MNIQKIPEKEISKFLEIVSNDIFRKPFKELSVVEKRTLNLNLIGRTNHDLLSVDDYHQIKDYIDTKVN